MNYYNDIKQKLLDNEIYSKVKDYSKERYKVITYFEIGKILNEAGGKYGDNIIEEYSKKLMIEVSKKYNRSTLFRMRQFYNIFRDEKVAPLAQQLSWSHYIELLPLKNYDVILYYLNICISQNLSRNDLRKRIKSNEYERLPKKTKNKLIEKEKTNIVDFIKEPIKIKNNSNYESMSEKVLQRLILENIPSFLKELGTGFTFIDNEYKIKVGDVYNRIDLLLYNYKFRCFVVVELKITELKKEHIGQLKFYMNYVDENLKSIEENKTVGIIICKYNNSYVIKYCSDERIIARSYELV